MFATFAVISLCRATSTSRKRLSASIIGVSIMPGLIMDITAPARQPVAANLIAHSAQTHSQKRGGAGAVAAGCVQRHLEQLALHVFKRHSGPQMIVPVRIAAVMLGPNLSLIPSRARQTLRSNLCARSQSH